MTVFATVIAITKDLPDVEGDRKFGIETFATRLGVRRIAWGAVSLLLANYVAAAVLAVTKPGVFCVPVMAGAHAVYAAFLVSVAIQADREGFSKRSIQGFYRNIWNLFYAEYVLLPFI